MICLMTGYLEERAYEHDEILERSRELHGQLSDCLARNGSDAHPGSEVDDFREIAQVTFLSTWVCTIQESRGAAEIDKEIRNADGDILTEPILLYLSPVNPQGELVAFGVIGLVVGSNGAYDLSANRLLDFDEIHKLQEDVATLIDAVNAPVPVTS